MYKRAGYSARFELYILNEILSITEVNMKSYKVEYSLNDNTYAWSNVKAVSESHARRKLERLVEKFYPEYKCQVLSCTLSESTKIRPGTQFICEHTTYMWDKPLTEGLWEVTDLESNTKHIATIDEDGNISDISPEPIEPGVDYGMATILNSLITDEYEAIEGYNSAIVTAQQEGLTDVVKILTDIQAEEQLHVGQLQRAMELFDPNARKVEQGVQEAEEQLSDDVDSEDIDGFINAYENYMKEGDTNA